MNEITLANKEQSLSGIERKVLEAVPIGESWQAQAVYAELKRCGHVIGLPAVMGVLAKLCDVGVVKTSDGGYRRTTRKPRVVAEASPPVELRHHAVEIVEEPQDPLSKLGRLAATLHDIAKELEDIALEVQAEIDEKGAAGQKLAALKSLLREI